MSLDTATLAALGMIVLAIAARIVTGHLLQGSKKSLSDSLAQVRALRAELGFAKDRQKAVEDVIHFGERQKIDLRSQIEIAQEQLQMLVEEDGEAPEEGVDREIKVARSLRRPSSDASGGAP